MESFRNGVVYKVGKGNRTLFWEHHWLGESPLKISFPNLYNVSRKKNNVIRQFFLRDAEGQANWNLDLRRRLTEIEIIEAGELSNQLQHVTLSEDEDQRRWKWTSDGVFTAVLRQLGQFGSDFGIVNEAEVECHEQLRRLYNSTRVAKQFQRNIVRNVESFVSISIKQLELVKKLAEDCSRYANENQSSINPLANAAFHFGASHKSIEEQRENFIKILDSQVSEPLRASIAGAPLDDARHLTQQYDRIRQEVDTQAAEVRRRQLKFEEAGSTSEVSAIKLKNAEAKLAGLKSTMMALGKEATAAMLSVEDQQQRLTCQRILTMVNAERSYHRSAVDSLEKLYAEMIISKQQIETASEPATAMTDVYVPPAPGDSISNKFDDVEPGIHSNTSFIAEVIHPFDAQADGELGLRVGDYIVVRQVTPHGWSEGEHMGKAGWFPSAYIEKRDIAPVSKVTEPDS